MKFFIDNNLSFRLVAALHPYFAGTVHIREALTVFAADIEIWEHAVKTGFIILTKDNDFDELSQLYGCPPKVVHLICGNKSTSDILKLIIENKENLLAFASDKEDCLLKIS